MNPIKKRRVEKMLTQVDLALLVGVSQVYISQFETGGLTPSESHTKKIIEILGIDEETLNRELHQFYEARRKELKKRTEGEQGKAKMRALGLMFFVIALAAVASTPVLAQSDSSEAKLASKADKSGTNPINFSKDF